MNDFIPYCFFSLLFLRLLKKRTQIKLHGYDFVIPEQKCSFTGKEKGEQAKQDFFL